MGNRLAGKVTIVTGAGSGIGRATALAFAREGALVVVNDIRPEVAAETVDLVKTAGGRAESVVGDVTDSVFVDELVNGAAARHGQVDVVHNNAGSNPASSMILDTTDERWKATVDINLNAVFYGMRAALRVMVPRGKGSIISTSTAGAFGGMATISAYSAAKTGILGLTRCAAVEYAHTGVRINVIAPSGMVTPAFEAWVDTLPGGMAQWTRQIPQGRMGRPEDIAATAVFLASDDSEYINGAVLPVDGGISAKLGGPHPG